MSSLPALGVQPSYPMYKDMVNLAATARRPAAALCVKF